MSQALDDAAFRKDPLSFARPEYVPTLLKKLSDVFQETENLYYENITTDPQLYGGYVHLLMTALSVGREKLASHRRIETEFSHIFYLDEMVNDHLPRARERKWYHVCDVLAWAAAWAAAWKSNYRLETEIRAFLADVHLDRHCGRWGIEALARLGGSDEDLLLATICDHRFADVKTYEGARAFRLCGADRATYELEKRLDACEKVKWDPETHKYLECLYIVGTKEARRLSTRSLLDRLFSRKRWLLAVSSRCTEYCADYSADSMIMYYRRYKSCF